ncbi:uncharacterized protein LOC121874895 [Homarus americanus]|uniref:Speckle-type POZ protein-like n=1 Tax=Homarus americanus TaxID=6706 RepID=A0A8J5MRR6_HOMAM|nr:uncharacterized protein LOC121874895 [Homarus americanus]XP_042235155.1 uncharacterized protein LOC121874895 [Homarus americanus]XP_042235156.1 uncharacterized protein LOC121874895 [Homarus americanus]XP_042235157.1 uncharacterized protein LOC121874895 [Homarus americanus]KAG7161600.1 Speckle-type POZ protein-like [Homarus americanus]
MEVEKTVAEVHYTVKIPQLSTYKELSHTFTTDFPLSLNGLRTLWRLTVTPFLRENGCGSDDPINRNIGISLECLKCNINRPGIEVFCSVSGRDEHEKQLTQSNDGLMWEGILVPRLALRIFKLLDDDQLTANLRFLVPGTDLSRAVDSLKNLSCQMKEVYKSGRYCDVEVITSDGVRLPAHRAVLRTRSNLLKEAKSGKRFCETDSTANTPLPEPDTPRVECHLTRPETPINSTFGSISSGYQSVASLSPDSSDSNTCRNMASPCLGHKSPMKASRTPAGTPSKVTFAPHTTTASPVKCSYTFSERVFSPSRATQSKRLLASSTTSPSKRTNAPSNSPMKRAYTPKEVVTRRLNQLHTQDTKNDLHCHENCPSPKCSNTPRSPLKEVNNTRVDGAAELTVRVNMSASVTQHLLEWIYTGECRDLGGVARPLMVAGLRHGVLDLARACEEHLAAALTPNTAPELLRLADKYGAATLREATLQYALTHAAEVTAQPSWACVASHAPTLILEFSRRLALHTYVKN